MSTDVHPKRELENPPYAYEESTTSSPAPNPSASTQPLLSTDAPASTNVPQATQDIQASTPQPQPLQSTPPLPRLSSSSLSPNKTTTNSPPPLKKEIASLLASLDKQNKEVARLKKELGHRKGVQTREKDAREKEREKILQYVLDLEQVAGMSGKRRTGRSNDSSDDDDSVDDEDFMQEEDGKGPNASMKTISTHFELLESFIASLVARKKSLKAEVRDLDKNSRDVEETLKKRDAQIRILEMEEQFRLKEWQEKGDQWIATKARLNGQKNIADMTLQVMRKEKDELGQQLIDLRAVHECVLRDLQVFKDNQTQKPTATDTSIQTDPDPVPSRTSTNTSTIDPSTSTTSIPTAGSSANPIVVDEIQSIAAIQRRFSELNETLMGPLTRASQRAEQAEQAKEELARQVAVLVEEKDAVEKMVDELKAEMVAVGAKEKEARVGLENEWKERLRKQVDESTESQRKLESSLDDVKRKLEKAQDTCGKLHVEKEQIRARLTEEKATRSRLEKAEEARIRSLREREDILQEFNKTTEDRVRRELEQERAAIQEYLKKERVLLEKERILLNSEVWEEKECLKKRKRALEEAEEDGRMDMAKKHRTIRANSTPSCAEALTSPNVDGVSSSGITPTPASPHPRDSPPVVDDTPLGGSPGLESSSSAHNVTQWKKLLETKFLDPAHPLQEKDVPSMKALFKTLEDYTQMTAEDLEVSGIIPVMENVMRTQSPAHGCLLLGIPTFASRACIRKLAVAWYKFTFDKYADTAVSINTNASVGF
ncbi:hypothetical protein ONZ45_g647 [Pleurotus djamor]|nr:hypothetical protein ONZ45_g647 [Pleurotus djamor]